MNKTLKYVGLLTILPLFTVALTTDYFDEANAMPNVGNDGIIADDSGSSLRLSRANVPAEIPLHKGFYDGKSVYFIITDSSDSKYSEIITKQQGWKVELAPPLARTPDAALSTTYIFTNGVRGDGVLGFQGEVFTSTPAQPEVYSALTSNLKVTWNPGHNPVVLDSEQAILHAQDQGKITLKELDVVINMPQIVWPEGQMQVKEDKTLTDETPYGGGPTASSEIHRNSTCWFRLAPRPAIPSTSPGPDVARGTVSRPPAVPTTTLHVGRK